MTRRDTRLADRWQALAESRGWQVKTVPGGKRLKFYPPEGSIVVIGRYLAIHDSGARNARAALRRAGLPV